MPIRSVAAATIVALFTGCASLNVLQPLNDQQTVLAPVPANPSAAPKMPVVVVGQPQISALTVTIRDPNGVVRDVSGELAATSPQRREGQVSTAYGNIQLIATGTLPCSTCSGGTSTLTVERNVCVYPGANTSPAKSFALVADNALGVDGRGPSPNVVPNAAGPETRWEFIRVGGFASSSGLIRSALNSCLCLRSPDASSGSAVTLATCRTADMQQHWNLLSAPGRPSDNLRIQNVNWGAGAPTCLVRPTTGGTVLVQGTCSDTGNSLWRVRNNSSGAFESNPF